MEVAAELYRGVREQLKTQGLRPSVCYTVVPTREMFPIKKVYLATKPNLTWCLRVMRRYGDIYHTAGTYAVLPEPFRIAQDLANFINCNQKENSTMKEPCNGGTGETLGKAAIPTNAKIEKLKSRKGRFSQVHLEHVPQTLPPPVYREVEVPLVLGHLVIRAVSGGGFTAGRPEVVPQACSFAFSSKADLLEFLEEVLPDGQ